VRLILAIQCFFAVLFGKAVPPKALPGPLSEPDAEKAEREQLARERDEAKEAKAKAEARVAELEAAGQETGKESADLKQGLEDLREKLSQAEAERDEARAALKSAEEARDAAQEAQASAESARGDLEGKVAELEERATAAREKAAAAEEKLAKARDDGALAVFGWLQREGRLIDFLKESIDDYDDEQVGAAVRAIHSGCRKVLDEGLALEPVLEGEEESPVEVPEGFDPVAIQLSGNVKGKPPYKGSLMHHGWRTTDVSVPVPETVDPRVLAPAEVEL